MYKLIAIDMDGTLLKEDKTVLLFRQIQAATKNGHDAEVRRDKDGNFVVYSVKKQRADKIQVK